MSSAWMRCLRAKAHDGALLTLFIAASHATPRHHTVGSSSHERHCHSWFQAEKSVALSGTAAGNTALCTVGRSGNDLHYRGYDILDLATTSEFEEIAYLLVHGKLPNSGELRGYKAKLRSLRGVPAAVKTTLEQLPPSAHPMDVMRTGVSVLGCMQPEKTTTTIPARVTSPTS